VSSTLAQFSQPQFWVAVVQIIWVDIVLSGDNAVVIAMACRGLPAHQRRRGLIIGAGVAAALLIVFTVAVSMLITLPYLRLISACALMWIAIRLLGPDRRDEADTSRTTESLWRAVRIIALADVVMGLDNAVAVAAVANGRYILLVLGLAVSIPTVVAGSAIVLALIERFPIIVWAGGAVLGWVAGELFVSDPVVASHLDALVPVNFDGSSTISEAMRHLADRMNLNLAELGSGVLGAVIVIIAGALWRHAGSHAPGNKP
jgi:YjbE family integral membrane protein